MPEGHTIHRYARRHTTMLAGRQVAVSSPQGRFTAGAGQLDGRVLRGVEAYGKHLFYRWEGAPSLHVHLGLFGRFAESAAADDVAPSAGTRLALRTAETVVHLSGPTACELVDPGDEERLLARLGPDPVRPDADPELAWAALRRRRSPIGAALLDQRVVAGIGNVYRAEALFLCGIDPQRPAADLDREAFDRLWATVVRLLRLGVRSGRIVTVEPAEAGRPRSRIPTQDGRYVYRRAGEPCRRCATPVVSRELAARAMYSCPTCQPASPRR